MTESSLGTVTSTTSPGRNVECAMTEAIATNLARSWVTGPMTKLTGVVRCRVTEPAWSTEIDDTWLEKAGGSWDATSAAAAPARS